MFGAQYASVESSNELLNDIPNAQPFGAASTFPSYNQQQRPRNQYQTMPQYDEPCAPCGEGGEGFKQEFNSMMEERQFDNFNPHAKTTIPGYNRQQSKMSRPRGPRSRQRSKSMSRIRQMTNSPILNMIQRAIKSTMNQLGVEPDWHDLTEDGGAIWKQSSILDGKSLWGRVFSRIEVNGQKSPCHKPVPHYGCITTKTNIKLDASLAAELQQELPMISYCPSTNLLTITMDTLEHNLAMLALVCGVQQDKLTYSKVKYYDLVKKYLSLTSPGSRQYRKGAKYSLVKFIHDRK